MGKLREIMGKLRKITGRKSRSEIMGKSLIKNLFFSVTTVQITPNY